MRYSYLLASNISFEGYNAVDIKTTFLKDNVAVVLPGQTLFPLPSAPLPNQLYYDTPLQKKMLSKMFTDRNSNPLLA